MANESSINLVPEGGDGVVEGKKLRLYMVSASLGKRVCRSDRIMGRIEIGCDIPAKNILKQDRWTKNEKR